MLLHDDYDYDDDDDTLFPVKENQSSNHKNKHIASSR